VSLAALQIGRVDEHDCHRELVELRAIRTHGSQWRRSGSRNGFARSKLCYSIFQGGQRL
jgi:hypothetical protein